VLRKPVVPEIFSSTTLFHVALNSTTAKFILKQKRAPQIMAKTLALMMYPAMRSLQDRHKHIRKINHGHSKVEHCTAYSNESSDGSKSKVKFSVCFNY
jgi:hypothetical protein